MREKKTEHRRNQLCRLVLLELFVVLDPPSNNFRFFTGGLEETRFALLAVVVADRPLFAEADVRGAPYTWSWSS